jgi:hypothetical protein
VVGSMSSSAFTCAFRSSRGMVGVGWIPGSIGICGLCTFQQLPPRLRSRTYLDRI